MTAVTDVIRPAGGASPEAATRPAPQASFDELLGVLQAMQVMATVQAPALPDAGVTAEESAREARIEQESDEARTAEEHEDATRHADPSSVQKGTVSSRHERIVAEKADRGGESPKAPTASPALGIPQPQQADRSAATLPEPKARQSQSTSTPPAPTVTEQADTAPQEHAPQPETKPVVTPTAAEPARTSAAPKVIAVPTAGAARAATEGRPVSMAQTLARMLASRSAEAPVRPVAGSAERQAARDTRTATSSTSKPAGRGEGRNSPESTQRSTFQKLINQVRLNQGLKQSQATIRLNPPELGRIKVNVRLVDQNLRVRVEAESPQARALLAGRAAELTAALRDHDLVVERFEIVAADPPPTFAAPQDVSDARDAQTAGDAAPQRNGDDRARTDGGSESADEAPDGDESAMWSESAEDPRLDVRV